MNNNQKKNTCDLSIILPAYKEAENLEILLPQLHDTLSNVSDPRSYEILVIDTMSPMDNTQEVCNQHKVRYISREGGNNYGDAIRTGIQHAQGTYTIFMDADGSHTPDFVKKMYAHRDDADVVIASRYVDGGATENSKILIFMSLIVNVLYAVILQLKCKDVSNSFKLYHTNQLQALHLYCNNFDTVEEILFKLKKNNKHIRFLELPYVFKKRKFGETKRNLATFVMTYIGTIIRLRFGK